MRLSHLLAALPTALAPRAGTAVSQDPVIRGISYDSRRVAPGDLFVALSGATADGHDYLGDALRLGAAALLLERPPTAVEAGAIPALVVPDTRRALAPLAVRFYGAPADECTLIGVTGTNGKTSTVYLVESILARAGLRPGLIGTVEVRYASERVPAVNTTPESLDLQRLLRAMRTQNIEAVAMEVSSHGLELGRIAGCRFRVAAFTNLTQDHLDFHGSMNAYFASKARLFRDHLAPDASAVVNSDDPAGEKLAAIARDAGARLVRCSRDPASQAEVRLLSAACRLDGTTAEIAFPSGTVEVEIPLVGDFNLENTLVACGISFSIGIAAETIAAGIAACPQVPGRMEVIGGDTSDAPTVIVDYAHTPDAIDKLLSAVRPLARGRLIMVFGCGGDRDRGKRALMARAVAANSDIAIATSDNPRTEDPIAILRDVESGLTSLRRADPDALGKEDGCYATIPERREAISLAIGMAGPDDTVVLAGKGHEDYQIIGRDKIPFDDRREAARALRARTSA